MQKRPGGEPPCGEPPPRPSLLRKASFAQQRVSTSDRPMGGRTRGAAWRSGPGQLHLTPSWRSVPAHHIRRCGSYGTVQQSSLAWPLASPIQAGRPSSIATVCRAHGSVKTLDMHKHGRALTVDTSHSLLFWHTHLALPPRRPSISKLPRC